MERVTHRESEGRCGPATPRAAVLRIAVIGLRHGERHVTGLRSVPGAVVTAICDNDTALLGRCGALHRVPEARRFAEIGALIDDGGFDAAVISLPNDLHASVGCRILAAGKHVLVDKPLAHTVEAGEALVAAAQHAGVELSVLQDFRAEPCAQFLWAAIQDGDLGTCHLVRTIWHRRDSLPQPPKYGAWYASRARSGGGPLIDLGVHRLDLALWCLGFPEVVDVSAVTFRHHMAAVPGADVEDTAAGFIRLANGGAVILETSFMGHTGRLEDVVLEVRGSVGGARITNVGDSYREYRIELYGRQHRALVDTVPTVLPPARSLYADFLEAVGGRRPPSLCSGTEALSVLRVVEELYGSAGVRPEAAVATF